jgi:cytochrome c-type biogenesis protein CcmE
MEHMEVSGPRKGSRLWVVGLVIVALAAGGVLTWLALGTVQERAIPIGDVMADLRTYDGTTVTVKGTVEHPTNILSLKFFTLRDESGEIMVVTQRGLPQEGEEVAVTGIVNQLFEVAGMQQTVITEPADDDQA